MEITREGACKDPEWAYAYAKDVDKYSKENTREGACKNPKYAYLYAKDVDKCSKENTRKVPVKIKIRISICERY